MLFGKTLLAIFLLISVVILMIIHSILYCFLTLFLFYIHQCGDDTVWPQLLDQLG